MSAFSSIYSSLSGLFGFSNALDNASDNVANINTPGYKGRDLNFRDLTDEQGNGVGVDVSGSSVRYQQGDINQTGNLTDLAIDGEGFFILREGTDTVYSRSGQFQFDEDGYLVDPASGRRVAALDNGGRISDVRIDRAAVSRAIESTIVSIVGGLDSQVAQGETFPGANDQPVEFEIIDQLGESHTLRAVFTRAGDNDWDVQLLNGNNIAVGQIFTIGFDESTGLPLTGENTINFTYQPFELVSEDNYYEFIGDSQIANVTAGDLATADPIVLRPEAGYNFLLRTNPDEGVEVSQTAQFRFDATGNLLDPATGRNVQALTTTGELEEFSIEDLLNNPGEATTSVVFQGNLDASILSGETLPQSFTADVLDAEGNSNTLTVFFDRNQNNTWDVRVEDASGNTFTTNGSIVFDDTGAATNGLASFEFSSFSAFTDLPIADVLDTVVDVNLTSAGDLSTAGQLTLGTNDEGEEAGVFFLLRSEAGSYSFLQDSALTVNSDGFLVDGNDNRLLTMDTAGAVTDIDLNSFINSTGQATSLLQFSGSLDPADPIGTTFPTSPIPVAVISAEGTEFQWQLSFEKLANNQWQANFSNDNGELVIAPIIMDFDPATGALSSVASTAINYQPTNDLSAPEISAAIQAPPPINIVGGDISTGVAANINLDQTDLENGGYFFTRAGDVISTSSASGSFVFDANSFLIDSVSGERVAGIDTAANNTLVDIDVSGNLTSSAVASTALSVSGTLDTSDLGTQTVNVNAYDANGGVHNLTLSLTQAGSVAQWDVQVFDENGVNIGDTSTSADIFFNNGTATLSTVNIQYDPLATGTSSNLAFSFSAVTAPLVAQVSSLQQISSGNGGDGRPVGQVTQVVYAQTGAIQFNYDNGDQQNVAQLAIREFNGSAMALNLDLQVTEDASFGTDVQLSTSDGLAEGDLTSFIMDSTGQLQFSYSNGGSVAGPQVAIVNQDAENSPIALDFSGATSVAGQATDLNVSSIDGILAGLISTLEFDENGVLQITYDNGETAEGPKIALVEERGSLIEDLTISFGDADARGGVQSQATGGSNLTIEKVDGRGAGNLTNISFDEDGFLTAEYANGEEEQLQRIGLAMFENLASIEPTSGSFFRSIGDKGIILGHANTQSFGSMAPSSLELSNVDLTSEFGNIIIIQRGYQAASQALNATNEVIEELYNTLRGG